MHARCGIFEAGSRALKGRFRRFVKLPLSGHEETEIVTKEYLSEEECERAGMAWQESAAVSFVCELRTERQLESQEKK